MSDLVDGSKPVLLFLHGDDNFAENLQAELGEWYSCLFGASLTDALEHLGQASIDLIVMDKQVGEGLDAFTVRERIEEAGYRVPSVMMTSHGDEDLAVESLRRGFIDYITKRGGQNLSSDLLRKRIESNLQLARLKVENEELQAAIEESQARLFNVYDCLDDVIMQVDGDCKVVSLNRSTAALADLEPQDAVGRTCHELFDFYPCRQREDKESCHIYRTFMEGETLRGEREDAATGRVFQYMTFITTLHDKDYTVYRETDVTEKRRLEEKLAEALKSLDAKPEE